MKTIILIIICLIIVATVGIFAYQFRNQAKIANQKVAVENPESSVSPELPSASPSATPVGIDKENLKIEVLNGSGMAGQAAKLKTKLVGLGYKDITTGNADEATSSSSIQFNGKITQDQKDLIVKDIQLILVVDVLKQASPDFDILLTIGSNSKL